MVNTMHTDRCLPSELEGLDCLRATASAAMLGWSDVCCVQRRKDCSSLHSLCRAPSPTFAAAARRMDTLPALEVAADTVRWNMQSAAVASDGTRDTNYIAAGFSRVSVWTNTFWTGWLSQREGSGLLMPSRPLVAEAAGSLLRFAPSTLRAYSVGPALQLRKNTQQSRKLSVKAQHGPFSGTRGSYASAAELAAEIEPCAGAAGIGVRLDEQGQQVHLTRL